MSVQFLILFCPQGLKNFWEELGLYLGPLSPQVTTPTSVLDQGPLGISLCVMNNKFLGAMQLLRPQLFWPGLA